MRYIVFGGAGHIGSEIVRQIRNLDKDGEIIVADKNIEKAKEVASEVGGEEREVDASSIGSLKHVLKDVDVAVGAIGPFYRFGVNVLKASIEAGVDFVDIDDDYDATEKSLSLDELAKKNNVTAVIGLGATPGITNLISKYAVEELDQVDEIHTAWAWTCIDPTEGPAIILHYLHASDGMVKTFKGGEVVEVKALSDPEYVDFGPIGYLEVANVGHPEPITLPKYIDGVKTVTNKGTVWPDIFVEATKLFSKLGLTSMKEIKIGGVSIPAREIITAFVMQLTDIAPEDTLISVMEEVQEKYGEYAFYGIGLNVRVYGVKNNEKVKYTYIIPFKSAAFATAYPAAWGAVLIGRERCESGVYPPEGIIDPKRFIADLKRNAEITIKREFTSRL